MVWASAVWMAVEMLATWCVRKLRGDARPSPYRVLSVAPGRENIVTYQATYTCAGEARLAREEAKDGHE